MWRPGIARGLPAAALGVVVGSSALHGARVPLLAAPAVAVAATTTPTAATEQAETLARQILDEAIPAADREAILGAHPELAVELIAAMVADLQPGTPEEYRRIPWIWRAAVAVGRRDDPAPQRRLLELAVPAADAPLTDWQAVVLGGGLINGITLAGGWPDAALATLLGDDPDTALAARWRRAVDLAAVMADDADVPTGTRYDALRMLGAESWDRRGAQLFRYLLPDVHPELQQGAISGLGDLRSPSTAQALLSGLGHYTEANRALALDALLRDTARIAPLLEAVAEGRLSRATLGPERVDALLQHPQPDLRRRAAELLGE